MSDLNLGFAGAWPCTGSMFRRAKSLLSSAHFAGVVDQALASGNNFLTVVLIGALSGAAALGGYALAFSAFLMISVVADGLIAWPFTLRRHESGNDSPSFAGSALVHLAVLSACVALGAVVVPWALAGPLPGLAEFARVATAFAVLVPGCLFRQFARRYEFAHQRPYAAVVIDSCVLIGQLGGLLWMGMHGNLSSAAALYWIGAVNGVVATAWLMRIWSLVSFWENTLSHWKANFVLGRWLAGSELMGMIAADFMFWLLAASRGVHATGVFSACFSVVMILNPLLLGFQNVFLPRCAAILATESRLALRNKVHAAMQIIAAGMLVFFVLIATVGGWLVAAIYRAPEYSGQGLVVALLGAQSIAAALSIPVGCGLNALQRSDIVFWAGVMRTVASLLVAWPLLHWFGLAGGAACLLVGTSVGLAVRTWAFYAETRVESCDAMALESEAA